MNFDKSIIPGDGFIAEGKDGPLGFASSEESSEPQELRSLIGTASFGMDFTDFPDFIDRASMGWNKMSS